MRLDRIWHLGDIAGEAVTLALPLTNVAISATFIATGAANLLGWPIALGALLGVMLELTSFAAGRAWFRLRRIANRPPPSPVWGFALMLSYVLGMVAAVACIIAGLRTWMYGVPSFVSITGSFCFTLAGDLRTRETTQSAQADRNASDALAIELARIEADKRVRQSQVRAEAKAARAVSPSPQEVQAVPVALSLDERRAQVAELHAQALSNAFIADRLQVHPSTITRDLAAIGSNGHS